ncbi:MAG TPA: metallophosphoesterase [Blastocatellia bacterium]|nr:metallophosphoesterase [Blastocatellia bacterium]
MNNRITRRQALLSLATIGAGALVRPHSLLAGTPAKQKLRFALIGDWGTGNQDETRVAEQMFSAHKAKAFDFVISAGDNIYPNGSPRHFKRNFEEPFNSILADRVNFYAVLGNHDVESGGNEQCQYPLFNMQGSRYYGLKKGDGLAEFFMLDSNAFDNSQAEWLENTLRASQARWKIAVFHHPIYSSGKTHGSAMGLRKKLEPMFTRYGVNIGLSGHDHIYERTKPQQGIQYFVSGAGGKSRRGDVNLKSELRSASYDDQSHFVVLEIEDKQVSFQAVSETGATVDTGLVTV